MILLVNPFTSKVIKAFNYSSKQRLTTIKNKKVNFLLTVEENCNNKYFYAVFSDSTMLKFDLNQHKENEDFKSVVKKIDGINLSKTEKQNL